MDTISVTWRFFRSVRLTIVLLFLIVVASIVGTFLPPKISLPLVYQSFWFIILLLLLCANLFVCSVERFRLQWLRLGFLLTHFSLIFILIGAVLALAIGERGFISIWDGDKANFFWRGEELGIKTDKSDEASAYPVDFTQRKPQKPFSENYDVTGTDLTLTVKRFFPDAHWKEEIVNASDQPRNPAMQIMLRSLSHETTIDKQWLFAADSSRDSYRLDIISVVYKWIASDEEFEQETKSSKSAKGLGQIVTVVDGKEISLDIEVGEKYRLKGTKYRIKVLQYEPDFRIDTTTKKAYSASDKPNNPALHVEVKGGEKPYKQWLFAKHAGMHMGNATEGAPTLRFVLRSVGVEVRLLDGPDIERTAVVKRDGQIVSQEPFVLEKPIPVQIGDSMLEVVALAYYPDAKNERTMSNGSHEEGDSAINCVLYNESFEQEFWLPFSESRTIETPAGSVTVAYRLKEVLLDFEIALKRFEVTYYPNTRKPRSFKSFVTVSDEESGNTFDEVIETNDPLKYKGYRFFQSSYREDRKRSRMATVLSVRKDPGVGFIYVGFCMLTLGVMCTFYLNPILRRKRKRRVGGVNDPAESEKEVQDVLS